MNLNEFHSFIPGTRANPREMNENFNFVLEEISTKANSDLSNLSKNGQDYIKNSSISKNIGELVYSCIPQTDSSLHLLDGSIVRNNGIYQNFVSYIANLSQNYPDLFTSETAWQQSVTDYGVCGKFVYDSTNNTVRLPKVTGIIEGTTDITALGDLVEAGLPVHSHTRGTMNITGSFLTGHYTVEGWGAFYDAGSGGTKEYGSQYDDRRAGFDASRSWTGSTSNPDYTDNIQNSSTVQPQTIKCFIYIVIANSAKTEIQVDIDNVATDLNGKADRDLSNMSASQSAKNEIISWGMPDYDNGIYVGESIQNLNYTAPADGIICGSLQTVNTSGTRGYLYINGHIVASTVSYSGTPYCPTTTLVNKNDVITTNCYIANVYFYPLKGAN